MGFFGNMGFAFTCCGAEQSLSSRLLPWGVDALLFLGSLFHFGLGFFCLFLGLFVWFWLVVFFVVVIVFVGFCKFKLQTEDC